MSQWMESVKDMTVTPLRKQWHVRRHGSIVLELGMKESRWSAKGVLGMVITEEHARNLPSIYVRQPSSFGWIAFADATYVALRLHFIEDGVREWQSNQRVCQTCSLPSIQIVNVFFDFGFYQSMTKIKIKLKECIYLWAYMLVMDFRKNWWDLLRSKQIRLLK